MLKSRIKKMGTVAMAGMMMVGALASSGMAVHAAELTDTGKTPVIYTGKYVPGSLDGDGNVSYGMLVPTSITFTNNQKESAANVSIVALGKNAAGEDATLNDFSELKVQVSVSSENGYKLVSGENSVNYQLKMEGQASDAVFDSGTDAKEITQRLGKSENCVEEAKGTATLLTTSDENGPFKDTLTYKFVEEEKAF
jgi:hypothetical protein